MLKLGSVMHHREEGSTSGFKTEMIGLPWMLVKTIRAALEIADSLQPFMNWFADSTITALIADTLLFAS